MAKSACFQNHKFTAEQQAAYEEARAHLEKALEVLGQIGKANQRDYDADHFAYKISEMLESDGGECGLIPFIKAMSN